MSDALSTPRLRSRIQEIVQKHATDDAKTQLRHEQEWRKSNDAGNKRREKEERKPVADQMPIIRRLKTEGLEELWDLVKDNKTLFFQNEYCRRTHSPCWIWQCQVRKKGSRDGSPFTKKQGYGYIGLLGLGKASLMVTHLALWTRSHSVTPTRRDHVSHLCHTPACFNPDHLCQEHRLMNAGRNGCLAFRDPQCLISDCIHTPACIVAHTANTDRVVDKSTVASEGTSDNSNSTPRKRKRDECENTGIVSRAGKGVPDEVDLTADDEESEVDSF